MAYNNFTLKKAAHDFQLIVVEEKGIFAQVEPVGISPHLAETLHENVPLAISINTEKARSELIIVNVLVELRRLFQREVSFFSGIEFNVDPSQELNGYCDFIVSLSPEQLFLNAPVITIVEAKNENIMAGFGQCIAEMIAAQLYNQQEESVIAAIYGVVTSGSLWKFAKLRDRTIQIDLQDYSIDNVEKILGILSAMLKQAI